MDGTEEAIQAYLQNLPLSPNQEKIIRELLSPFVSDPFGDIFVVKNLPNLTGGVYARYSRAPTGFRQTLLREFLKENILDHQKATELLLRVLVEYGDDSVGELEGAHVSFENISNLAAKAIEDCRIGGSPIEQSTRYVFYDKKDRNENWRYHRDQKIMSSSLAGQFTEVLNFCFQTYQALVEPMQGYFRRLKPLEEATYEIREKGRFDKFSDLQEEKDRKAFLRTYQFDIRSKTCDTIRCVLPAATTTHVGVFGNGRFFQGLLTKLYSHSLSEMNQLAAGAHRELNTIIPTYVRRAKADEYVIKRDQEMVILAQELLRGVVPEKTSSVFLLTPGGPENFMISLLTEVIFPYAHHPTPQLRSIIGCLSPLQRQRLIETSLGNRRSRHNRVGRAYEYGYPLTFDLMGDFGIYRDLQRHRMLTQQRQALTPYLGFDLPREIIDAGFSDRVLQCVEASRGLYEKIVAAGLQKEAEYVVLFGHHLRWRMGMNLREAEHFLELRTIKQGHPSYRKLCAKMAEEILQFYPELKDILSFVDPHDYYWSRAESEAAQRRKESALEQVQERVAP